MKLIFKTGLTVVGPTLNYCLTPPTWTWCVEFPIIDGVYIASRNVVILTDSYSLTRTLQYRSSFTTAHHTRSCSGQTSAEKTTNCTSSSGIKTLWMEILRRSMPRGLTQTSERCILTRKLTSTHWVCAFTSSSDILFMRLFLEFIEMDSVMICYCLYDVWMLTKKGFL